MANQQENFQDEKLPHELFLTTRQATKNEFPLLQMCQQT